MIILAYPDINRYNLSEYLFMLRISREYLSNVSPPPVQQRKKRLFDAFAKPSTAGNEVREYLALEEVPFENDPYAWWNERKKISGLSQLSRKILGIRVASTPSERFFSDAWNLLTVKRTRMKPEPCY